MEYIENDAHWIGGARHFDREHVAQTVEDIIAQMRRRTKCDPAEIALWETFPARVRAHSTQLIRMDINRPIKDYLMSGEIGPMTDDAPALRT